MSDFFIEVYLINILSQVSIIEYARKADIKKGLNDRFKEIYPHVELSLTKLDKSVTRSPLPESAPSFCGINFSSLTGPRESCTKWLLR
jgi:hypothetical protein